MVVFPFWFSMMCINGRQQVVLLQVNISLHYISASQYIMAGKACEKFAVFVYGVLEKFRQKFIFFV